MAISSFQGGAEKERWPATELPLFCRQVPWRWQGYHHHLWDEELPHRLQEESKGPCGCEIKERFFCPFSALQWPPDSPKQVFSSNKDHLFSQTGNMWEPVLERLFNGGKRKPFLSEQQAGPHQVSLMTDVHLDVACGAPLNSPRDRGVEQHSLHL